MKKRKWRPTDLLPGTPDKLEEMRMRAQAGLPVFCPGDATLEETTDAPPEESLGGEKTEDTYRRFLAGAPRAERVKRVRRPPRWRVELPTGESCEVEAWTRCEARGFAKRVFGLETREAGVTSRKHMRKGKLNRLPEGTTVTKLSEGDAK